MSPSVSRPKIGNPLEELVAVLLRRGRFGGGTASESPGARAAAELATARVRRVRPAELIEQRGQQIVQLDVGAADLVVAGGVRHQLGGLAGAIAL